MDLKKATVSNVKWSFIESASIKLINFFLTIILARLLTPYDFGVLAVVNVFYLITVSFIDGGLKEALIQKKDATEADYSSVFWMNIILAFLIYSILFIAAPYIQKFYGFENLAIFIRIQALSLIIDSLALVQLAKSTKELNLKKITKSRIPASLISFLIGVTLAYLNYGIFSLIIQQIAYSIIYVILIWKKVAYKPDFIIDIKRLKNLYSFGIKLFAAGYINRVYVQSMNFIYAKVFTASALGAYTKSNNMIGIPIKLFTLPIISGLYPTMVKLQDDNIKLRAITKHNLKITQIICSVLCAIMIFNAADLVQIVLGVKWLIMVPFLKMVAIGMLFNPISTIAKTLFKVKGKAGLFLRLELIRKGLSLIVIFLLLDYGFVEVIIGVTLVNIIMTLVDISFLGKLISYKLGNQLLSLIVITGPILLTGFITNMIVIDLTDFIYQTHILLGIRIIAFLLLTIVVLILTQKTLVMQSFKLLLKK